MKHIFSILLLVLILLLFAFLYSNTGVVSITDTPKTPKPVVEVTTPEKKEEPKKIELSDKIIDVAKESLGLPYKQGGTTKNGFDCSGLVMTSFAKHNVSLPRASYQMAEKGKEVSLEDAQKGDLIFFNTNENKPDKISHVGLVTAVKNNVVYFIHSTDKKGVIISNTTEAYYKKSFSKIKRVL